MGEGYVGGKGLIFRATGYGFFFLFSITSKEESAIRLFLTEISSYQRPLDLTPTLVKPWCFSSRKTIHRSEPHLCWFLDPTLDGHVCLYIIIFFYKISFAFIIFFLPARYAFSSIVGAAAVVHGFRPDPFREFYHRNAFGSHQGAQGARFVDQYFVHIEHGRWTRVEFLERKKKN